MKTTETMSIRQTGDNTFNYTYFKETPESTTQEHNKNCSDNDIWDVLDKHQYHTGWLDYFNDGRPYCKLTLKIEIEYDESNPS